MVRHHEHDDGEAIMYIVIGGNGFLGRYCLKNILERTDAPVIATYAHGDKPPFSHERLEWFRLDVRDNDALDRLNRHIDIDSKCIYLAAYHHPDKVEENPTLAWNINIVALAEAVNRLTKLSCLYYVSTDTVYGEGSNEQRFLESDECRPVNLYGKHKVLAERIVLTAGFNVIRFPFIFGPSLVKGRPHFFDYIRETLQSGKGVEMFADSYRSTLSFDQCAFYLVSLIEKYGRCPENIVNIAGDDVMSKYDAALALADACHLNRSLIKPVSIHQNTGIFKAKRASSSILDNSKLKKLLNLDEIHFKV